MSKYVIDTNVPIVANGNDTNISIDCRIASIKFLLEAVEKGVIVLDSAGAIQDEYRTHLNPKGQPGVGDRFYLEVINSHPDRVLRVEVALRPDGQYDDLPQPIIDAGFDPSDRVFAAVASKAKAVVYNAVDTDWLEQMPVIEECGISIVFLCGCDPRSWRTAPLLE